MSQFLRDVLGNSHPLFASHLAQMERAAGEAVASRLIADITERAHLVMQKLGIDTADKNAEELYFALNAAAHSHNVEHLLAASSWVVLPFVDGPVSLNLQDVVDNAHHELPFADRRVGAGQRHLRQELTRRFSQHARTHTPHIKSLAKEAGMTHSTDRHYGNIDKQLRTDKRPSLLAIGDIFTDAFIELDQDVARVDIDTDGAKRLSLPLGSKPPYKGVDIIKAVGPSPNAAVACARLGLRVSLMSWLGDDATQQEAIDHLHSEHIDTNLVSSAKDTVSNYYYVLRYGAERTILVKNQNFEYEWVLPKTPPDWLYLSLIADASWPLHEDMIAYLKQHPQTKLAFQPGTFHFKWGAKKLKKIYERTHIIVLNREEAVDVTQKSYDDIRALADGLHSLGPKIVVITDGPNGSYASYDKKLVTIANYPDPKPPVDRTGAGDAFASTIVAALALGKSMDEALLWAPINSMSVVQQLGAQAGLLSQKAITTFQEKAPENYKVRKIT